MQPDIPRPGLNNRETFRRRDIPRNEIVGNSGRPNNGIRQIGRINQKPQLNIGAIRPKATIPRQIRNKRTITRKRDRHINRYQAKR